MSYDAHANLAITNVATAPSPSTTGTSLTVTTGAGALFPATPFNCTIYPPSTIPTQSSAEIIRVTAVVGDVLTITRAQEGTTAKAIKAGWLIANTATALTFTDIEDSIIQFVSAGTTKASASEVIFSNANGVSFGADGQTITASVAGAGAGSVSFSAGTESAALDSIVFSNSNGVSFGLDGSTMTASIVPGAAAISFSAGTESATLDSIVFSNSNGVTFGLDGSTITASVGAGGVAGSISAGTTSVALGQVIFSNSNGVSFGLDGSTVTASVAGGAGSVNFSGGTTSNNLASITFSNSNGISFGLNAGTMTASHNALTSQSNQAASASNGSFAFQTLGFSNANNVTFGTSAGSIITASVATIAAAPVNFSAGTTSNNIGSIVFSNSNGISFGLNGSTITASGGGGGGALSYNRVHEVGGPFNTGVQTLVPYASFEMAVDPMFVQAPLSFETIQQIISAGNPWPASTAASATGSMQMTFQYGFYSRSVTDSAATNFSNSSILTLGGTGTWGLTVTSTISSSSKSASFVWGTDSTGGTSSWSSTSNGATWGMNNGWRQQIRFGVPIGTTLSVGDWWLGRLLGSTSNNNCSLLSFSFYDQIINGNVTSLSNFGDTNSAQSVLNNMVPGLGIFSTTTASLPASIALSDIAQPSGNTIGKAVRRYYVFK